MTKRSRCSGAAVVVGGARKRGLAGAGDGADVGVGVGCAGSAGAARGEGGRVGRGVGRGAAGVGRGVGVGAARRVGAAVGGSVVGAGVGLAVAGSGTHPTAASARLPRMPSGQRPHTVPPSAPWKRPVGQSLQSLMPALCCARPGTHAVQRPAPSSLNRPAGHAPSQLGDPPLLPRAPKWPARHTPSQSASVAPGRDQRPVGHTPSHSAEVEPPAPYRPAGHLPSQRAAREPPSPYRPAPHVLHQVGLREPPPASLYLPAGQTRHDASGLLWSMYSPAVHVSAGSCGAFVRRTASASVVMWQPLAPDALTVPVAQRRHAASD